MVQEQEQEAQEEVRQGYLRPTKKADEEFLQRSLRDASRLTEDPFSKTMRDRQKLLLVSSVLTLALSFSVVAVKEAKSLGLHVDSALQTQSLATISWVATIYLLFLFSITAFQESAAADFRHAYVAVEWHRYLGEIQKSMDEKMQHLMLLAEKHLSLFRESSEGSEKIYEIQSGYQAKSEPLRQQRYEISKQMLSMPPLNEASPTEELNRAIEEHARLYKKHNLISDTLTAICDQEKEELAPYKQLRDAILKKEQFNDGLVKQLFMVFTSKESNLEADRVGHLRGVFKKVADLKRGRKIIEIYAPLVLGIGSVICSMCKMHSWWPF